MNDPAVVASPSGLRSAWLRFPRSLRVLVTYLAGAAVSLALLGLVVLLIATTISRVSDRREAEPRRNFEANVLRPIPAGVEILISQFEGGGGWGWKTSRLRFKAPKTVLDEIIRKHGLLPKSVSASQLSSLQKNDWIPQGECRVAYFPKKPGDPPYGILFWKDTGENQAWFYKGLLPVDAQMGVTPIPP